MIFPICIGFPIFCCRKDTLTPHVTCANVPKKLEYRYYGGERYRSYPWFSLVFLVFFIPWITSLIPVHMQPGHKQYPILWGWSITVIPINSVVKKEVSGPFYTLWVWCKTPKVPLFFSGGPLLSLDPAAIELHLSVLPVVSCSCILRFPSTNIKIVFAVISNSDQPPGRLPSPPRHAHRPKIPTLPLKIHIPEHVDISRTVGSPCPSPTGTIRSVKY